MASTTTSPAIAAGRLPSGALARPLIDRRRLLTLAAVGVILIQGGSLWVQAGMYDALIYWAAPQDGPYTNLWGDSSFIYSPVFLQALAPVQSLTWSMFALLWLAAELAILVWLVGPLWTALLLLGPIGPHSWNPVVSGLWWSNIPFFMMLAAAVLQRYPAAGAFLILSKVTPGVAILYFVGARQWRSLALALGATAALAGVSYLAAPHLWSEWISLLLRSSESNMAGLSPPLEVGPIWLRTTVAGVIVLWGGATGRPWTIIAAVFLAQPGIWPASVIFLLALPRLGIGRGWYSTLAGRLNNPHKRNWDNEARGVVR